jgi:hypothetical protein
MVNFFPNQRLLINMRLDDKGMERLQEMVVFLNGLKQSAALTQAEVDRIEGIATYFKQSGIRLDHRSDVNVDQRSDHKSDIKVDTKEGIEVHQTQNSLFR